MSVKDIDFDELDKAVNSLMGSVKDESDQPAPKTLSISTTLKEGEEPAYDKIQVAAEKIGSETVLVTDTAKDIPDISTKDGAFDLKQAMSSVLSGAVEPVTSTPAEAEPVRAPAATDNPAPLETPVTNTPEDTSTTTEPPAISHRPSGRFMDVMHPSSDMKTTTGTAASVSRPVSREGVAVEPPVDNADTPAEETPVVAEPQPEETRVASEDMPAAEPVSSEPNADDNEALVPANSQVVETPPLTSPFLPDAKVEKRPLGGMGVSDTPVDDSTIVDMGLPDPVSMVDATTDAQLDVSNVAMAERELPAELNADLLALEADGPAALTAESEMPESPELTDEATVYSEPEASESLPIAEDQPASPLSQEDTSAADKEVDEVVTANTSTTGAQIPSPQSTDAVPEGAIYDVAPIKHPVKRGHEWLWVALVIVIVVICGVGAAAFYLLSAK